jgi:diguanylate cyclase (GGDEF)-like protein
MTGLFNDEYVKEKLNQKNHNYSVIFIDIARFKGINDNYGQNFGDDCIKAVAQFLEEHAKIDDKVCRNG